MIVSWFLLSEKKMETPLDVLSRAACLVEKQDQIGEFD